MTAASVLGVVTTPARAAACRELLAGVASRGAWLELGVLVGVAEQIDRQPARGPVGAIFTKAPFAIHALARCVLGSACARCQAPIEQTFDVAAIVAALKSSAPLPPLQGEELDDGWCCSACVARQREQEAFRRRAARWLRRGHQMGLFGVEPARARRRRR